MCAGITIGQSGRLVFTNDSARETVYPHTIDCGRVTDWPVRANEEAFVTVRLSFPPNLLLDENSAERRDKPARSNQYGVAVLCPVFSLPALDAYFVL
jgi:hypothetical protein